MGNGLLFLGSLDNRLHKGLRVILNEHAHINILSQVLVRPTRMGRWLLTKVPCGTRTHIASRHSRSYPGEFAFTPEELWIYRSTKKRPHGYPDLCRGHGANYIFTQLVRMRLGLRHLWGF